MPSKSDSRPQGRRLLANLVRLARTVQQLEESGHKDPDVWKRLRRVVPALADCLADMLDAKEEP